MNTPLHSIVLVLIAAFIGSIGMALLKAGASRLELNVRALLTNWRLGLGIALYGVSSIFFVLGIRVGELSVLYPMNSLGYVWALAWAHMFFKERLTTTKFAGLGMILCGVVLLSSGR